ncbi:hypothetical protein N665_0163s0054 [Sinapis alba]|nr:hypothetical protein N665_0163s0054 [Sinapis alba]
MEYARRHPSHNSQNSEIPRHRTGHRESSALRQEYTKDHRNRPIPSRSYSSRYRRHPQENSKEVTNLTPVRSPDRNRKTLSAPAQGSQLSHTPPPRPHREPMEKTPFSPPPHGSNRSKDRRPALERIMAPDLRDHLPRRLSPINSPGDFVGATHGRETLPPPPPETGVSPQTSFVGDPEREHTRAPATLRLGGLASLGSREETRKALESTTDLPTEVATKPTKQGAKRRITRTSSRRGARSPMQGLKLSKTVVTRTSNPPRKRICTEKGRSLPWNKAGPSGRQTNSGSLNAVTIPSGKDAGTDFQSPPPPLP